MFNIGGGEMVVILLLALLVLGPERLPKAMGQLGRTVAQLRRMSSGFQDEIRRAMDPMDAPFRPGEQTLKGPIESPGDEVRVVSRDDGPTGPDLTKRNDPTPTDASGTDAPSTPMRPASGEVTPDAE